MILITAVLAAYTEWLARWPSSHELRANILSPINLSHVAAEYRPVFDMLYAARAIVKHRFNRIGIPFHEQIVMETGASQSESKSPTPCEQFDAPHDLLPFRSVTRRSAKLPGIAFRFNAIKAP